MESRRDIFVSAVSNEFHKVPPESRHIFQSYRDVVSRRSAFWLAPRSPSFAYTLADQTSQTAHRRRIEASGGYPSPFQDQGDVARKSMRSFLHFRVDPTIDPVEPAADALIEAWAYQEAVVEHLAEAIKKPDPRAVPVTDPANVAAFVAAVRSAAERLAQLLVTIFWFWVEFERLPPPSLDLRSPPPCPACRCPAFGAPVQH